MGVYWIREDNVFFFPAGSRGHVIVCYAVYSIVSAMDIATLVAIKIKNKRNCLHARLKILAVTVYVP